MKRSIRFNPFDDEPLHPGRIQALLHADEELLYPPDLPERHHGLQGPPEAVFALMESSRSYRLWERGETSVEHVEPSRIVYTDHSSYQAHYPLTDTGDLAGVKDENPGARGNPGDGYLTGWDRPIGDDYVWLLRHPELRKYVVINGNHRVMKSKMSGGPPIHAKVTATTWRPIAQAVRLALAHFKEAHSDLLVEEILPFSSDERPGLLVLKVRPNQPGARRFFVRLDDGSYDSKKVGQQFRIATETAWHPHTWLALIGSCLTT